MNKSNINKMREELNSYYNSLNEGGRGLFHLGCGWPLSLSSLSIVHSYCDPENVIGSYAFTLCAITGLPHLFFAKWWPEEFKKQSLEVVVENNKS